jgi:hypothetical protein
MKIIAKHILFTIAIFASLQSPCVLAGDSETAASPAENYVSSDRKFNVLYNFIKGEKEKVYISDMTEKDMVSYVPQFQPVIDEYWRMIKEDNKTPQMAVYKLTELMVEAIKKKKEQDQSNNLIKP